MKSDEAKQGVTIIGTPFPFPFIWKNLMKINSKPVSDTEEITEPGAGGERVFKDKKDSSRIVEVEVTTGSNEELALTRLRKYKAIPFTINWFDSRTLVNAVPVLPQSGIGINCFVKDKENDRSAETQTFEIYCSSYTGD